MANFPVAKFPVKVGPCSPNILLKSLFVRDDISLNILMLEAFFPKIYQLITDTNVHANIFSETSLVK